jgi:hypothetical protein
VGELRADFPVDSVQIELVPSGVGVEFDGRVELGESVARRILLASQASGDHLARPAALSVEMLA